MNHRNQVVKQVLGYDEYRFPKSLRDWDELTELSLITKPELLFTLALKKQADPWQAEVLKNNYKRLILRCARQVGKSTAIAGIALNEALFGDHEIEGDIILLSKSYAQAKGLLKKVQRFYSAIGRPYDALPLVEKSKITIHRDNRDVTILSLPENEETVRGYTARMLIIDEAARVDDEMYYAITPMVETTGGSIIMASTPYGKTGVFYNECDPDNKGLSSEDWKVVKITWQDCPRLNASKMIIARRKMGEHLFRREYEAEFVDLATGSIPSEYLDLAEKLGEHLVPFNY